MNKELLAKWIGLDERKRDLKDQLAEVQMEIGALEPQLLNDMTAQGIQHVKVNGKTAYISELLTPSLKQDRDTLTAALASNETTAWLVKPGYNVNSLGAYLRDGDRKDKLGNPIIPDHLTDFVELKSVFSLRTRKG